MQRRWWPMLILLIVWNCSLRYSKYISTFLVKAIWILLVLNHFFCRFQLKRLKLRRNNWDSDTYEFDEVLTEFSSQKRVYEVVAKPVVEVACQNLAILLFNTWIMNEMFIFCTCFYLTHLKKEEIYYWLGSVWLIYWESLLQSHKYSFTSMQITRVSNVLFELPKLAMNGLGACPSITINSSSSHSNQFGTLSHISIFPSDLLSGHHC